MLRLTGDSCPTRLSEFRAPPLKRAEVQDEAGEKPAAQTLTQTSDLASQQLLFLVGLCDVR